MLCRVFTNWVTDVQMSSFAINDNKALSLTWYIDCLHQPDPLMLYIILLVTIVLLRTIDRYMLLVKFGFLGT